MPRRPLLSMSAPTVAIILNINYTNNEEIITKPLLDRRRTIVSKLCLTMPNGIFFFVFWLVCRLSRRCRVVHFKQSHGENIAMIKYAVVELLANTQCTLPHLFRVSALQWRRENYVECRQKKMWRVVVVRRINYIVVISLVAIQWQLVCINPEQKKKKSWVWARIYSANSCAYYTHQTREIMMEVLSSLFPPPHLMYNKTLSLSQYCIPRIEI